MPVHCKCFHSCYQYGGSVGEVTLGACPAQHVIIYTRKRRLFHPHHLFGRPSYYFTEERGSTTLSIGAKCGPLESLAFLTILRRFIASTAYRWTPSMADEQG